MFSIGLMSGTSMDGIDAALIKTNGQTAIEVLETISIGYDPAFKVRLKIAEFAVRESVGNMMQAEANYSKAAAGYLTQELNWGKKQQEDFSSQTLAEVIQQSTLLHIQAVKKLVTKANYASSKIDVIGYHGQTLFHAPERKVSIIIGDGQRLADATGVTVINNFRQNDIDAGGQGAPFAPLYHQALAIRDKKIPVAVVNCGGISNVTIINSDDPLGLIGFDTGPGNALIDRFVRQRTQGKESMDKDGHYGQKGQVSTAVLKALYEKSLLKQGQNYFNKRPPKSLDYGDMKLIDELHSLTLEDGARTLEAFTADSIVESAVLLKADLPKQWVLCGGGWKNPVIFSEFKSRLQRKLGRSVRLHRADELGWNSQFMEAELFAYLAVRSLQELPLSFPNTTQVPKPLCGGVKYQPKKV